MNEKETQPAHDPGTRKGEELTKDEGQEAGRQDTGTTDTGRATGTSTARHSTGVSPDREDPIDPASPTLPPP